MNQDLLKTYLGSALRWVLMLGAGYAAKNGIIATDDTSKVAEAAVLALTPLIWGLYQKWEAHKVAVAALNTTPGNGATLATVKAQVAEAPRAGVKAILGLQKDF